MDRNESDRCVAYTVESYRGPTELLRPLLQSWYADLDHTAAGLSFDIDKVAQRLQRLCDSEQSDILLLVKHEQVVGFLGIEKFVSLMSDETIGWVHYIYVCKPYRGKGSLVLLRSAERWAKEHGCDLWMISASKTASPDYEKLGRWYERCGLRPCETHYVKALSSGEAL